MSGLFGTLNIGKSGLFGQQGAINVTGHNIANANTEGYSRQRVELETTRPYCKPSMNSTVGPGQIGTGVQIAAINRVRDSFLDYQTRVEKGVEGQFKNRNKFLSQIENILREPTDAGISNLIGKFFDAWGDLSIHAETSNARKVVMEQSQALANELNHTYNELIQLKTNTQMEINNTVFEVNNILNQINQLNQEIIQVKIAHQQPNDLMDRRDLLLDKLSEKFGIDIKRGNFEGLDITTCNNAKNYQKKTSELGGEPPTLKDKAGKDSPLNLVQTINPEDVCRFSYITEIKPEKEDDLGKKGKYTVTYYKDGDTKFKGNKRTIEINIQSEAEYKRLDECRVIWTDKNGNAIKIGNNEGISKADNTVNSTIADGGSANLKELKIFEPPSGEFRGLMSVQQDIDKYQDELNKLAKALTFSVNAVHCQKSEFDKNDNDTGLNFFINGKNPDKEDEITAQNITINDVLVKDPMKIRTGKSDIAEGDGTRALAISQLRDTFMAIQDIGNYKSKATTERGKFMEGYFSANKNLGGINVVVKNTNGMTLDSYFNDLIGGLGVEEQEADRMVKNQKVLLAGFKQARDSVSGVSLDEEFANIVKFSHCYQANAKIISTVDQLLDVVINGLKR